MNERRQTTRWEVKKEAVAWIPDLQSLNYCIIEDMHLNGMGISCSKELFHQKEMGVYFMLEGNLDFIEIQALINWKKITDAGRCFYGLSFHRGPWPCLW
jgi:hypothetical protein